ncbi:hypothetical protein FOWG_18074 [Fusarium oxysporum f. sp. lycopersici MN25]|nr:hypothetical protein FOWG_18074 [Fusarium oxysporum f. sp. lycopersici MN25]
MVSKSPFTLSTWSTSRIACYLTTTGLRNLLKSPPAFSTSAIHPTRPYSASVL